MGSLRMLHGYGAVEGDHDMSKEGRFWMPNWMLGSDGFKKLTADELRVLMLLARMADDIGVAGLVPSDLVAEVVDVPVGAVPEILVSLVSVGILEKTEDGEYRIPTKGKEG